MKEGYSLKKIAKCFLVVILLIAFSVSLTACGGSDNGLPRNINRAMVGTWELYEANMWGLSNVVEFRSDGTGTMSLGAMREDFTWSIDNNDDLVIVQGGGLLTIAYTITELTDSRLSYEADIPGLGFIQVTYTR